FDLVDEAEFFGSDWLEQAASAQGAFVAGQLHKRQARLRRKSQVAEASMMAWDRRSFLQTGTQGQSSKAGD
ncbi:MAG: hypothetical protein WAM72_14840, partial [Xanthobacteraceae bacterium]